VPRIIRHISSVSFTSAEAASQRGAGDNVVGDLIDQLLDDGSRTDGESYGIFLLSGPSDPATTVLQQPIENDAVAATGRRVAWVQNQRYTSLDRLGSGARFTSEL
jgi:hypothetical protein